MKRTGPERRRAPHRTTAGASAHLDRRLEPTTRHSLDVILPTEERKLTLRAGQSVRDALEHAGLHLHAFCGGVGLCGRCRVRIEAEALNELTPGEMNALGGEQRERGIRLACQARPASNARVHLDAAHIDSAWRALDESPGGARLATSTPSITTAKATGIAIDLGTTQIRVSAWDRAGGRRLAALAGFNPQSIFGADVVTRIAAASASRATAEMLRNGACGAIREALAHLRDRHFYEADAVDRIVIVGNTAMLTILAGRNFEKLLRPETWMSPVECLPVDTSALRAAWSLDEIPSIDLVAPLAGFVGSDLVAATLASGLVEGPPLSLIVDFGTNSEIALWDGTHLWATSAAGGPAFEGCGISCGMPAERGAVTRVRFPSSSGHAPSLEILGGEEPRGLAGSGVVDVVAGLLRTGHVNGTGVMSRACAEAGFVLDPGGILKFQRRDIDVFQRAKAAVAAAIEVLMARSGNAGAELSRLVICGAFGRHLDAKNAFEVGLIPVMPPERMEFLEDAALCGSERILAADDPARLLAPIRRCARVLNLALDPIFEERFIQNLYLRPLAWKGTS